MFLLKKSTKKNRKLHKTNYSSFYVGKWVKINCLTVKSTNLRT